MLVLSHYQATPVLRARQKGLQTAESTPDLGLTTVAVELTAEGVIFPAEDVVSWAVIEAIATSVTKCFLIEHGEASDIRVFSECTGWVRSLMPTEGAPTMLVSGVSMHRIKGTDPYKDTLLKVRTVAPLTGRVLDTATGLGYTAIEAARTATEVVTIEIDPAGLEVARLNPWSRALFENPRIRQIVGDAFDEIQEIESASFDRVIHDPPAFSLGGELYSGEFYAQLFRVMKRGARLFHYIGDLESKSGRTVSKGVIRRLEEAGFSRIARRTEAFGVTAAR